MEASSQSETIERQNSPAPPPYTQSPVLSSVRQDIRPPVTPEQRLRKVLTLTDTEKALYIAKHRTNAGHGGLVLLSSAEWGYQAFACMVFVISGRDSTDQLASWPKAMETHIKDAFYIFGQDIVLVLAKVAFALGTLPQNTTVAHASAHLVQLRVIMLRLFPENKDGRVFVQKDVAIFQDIETALKDNPFHSGRPKWAQHGITYDKGNLQNDLLFVFVSYSDSHDEC